MHMRMKKKKWRVQLRQQMTACQMESRCAVATLKTSKNMITDGQLVWNKELGGNIRHDRELRRAS